MSTYKRTCRKYRKKSTYQLEMSHLEGMNRKREKQKIDQFKGQRKMSLEYICSPKGSHDKMRYNGTERLQLALDV